MGNESVKYQGEKTINAELVESLGRLFREAREGEISSLAISVRWSCGEVTVGWCAEKAEDLKYLAVGLHKCAVDIGGELLKSSAGK